MNHIKIRRISTNLLKTVVVTTIILSGFIRLSLAAPKIGILGATYGGSGCPNGSATIKNSSSGEALIIRANKYIANGSRSKESRKNCSLTIPLKVPRGYQVSVRSANYQGYIASATTGYLRSEYFFAGETGTIFNQTITGRKYYNIRDKVMPSNWSQCGNSVNMRVNTSINAKGKGIAKVQQITINWGWRRCR